MSSTLCVTVGLMLLPCALFILLGSIRGYYVHTGKICINNFQADGSDLAPFATRLTKAYNNALANSALLLAPGLLALATEQTQLTDPLLCWLLAARLGQVLCQLVGQAPWLVVLRFGFYLSQLLLISYCGYLLTCPTA